MRLITRSDFDGICCAVLLFELGIVDEMIYAHPKDLQAGDIPVTGHDVLANVPWVAGCGMWFDHHSSEDERLTEDDTYEGCSRPAASAARVIYDYYAAPELEKFTEMMAFVDKVDSGDLTAEEILDPEGWILLGFICDPRSGLGYHRDFEISNLQLMRDLVEHIRNSNIAEIMEQKDVKQRADRYRENNAEFKKFLTSHCTVEGKIVITDTRGATNAPPGNRFLVYSLFPQTNIEIRVIDGRNKEFAAISVGRSILDRSSTVDIGKMLLAYGGGGHTVVGTCQVPYADAERVLAEIKAKLVADG